MQGFFRAPRFWLNQGQSGAKAAREGRKTLPHSVQQHLVLAFCTTLCMLNDAQFGTRLLWFQNPKVFAKMCNLKYLPLLRIGYNWRLCDYNMLPIHKIGKNGKRSVLRQPFDFEFHTNEHDSVDHRGNSFKDKNDNTDFSSISEVVLVAKGEGGRDLYQEGNGTIAWCHMP